jgi:RNA-directed DNA polymerase
MKNIPMDKWVLEQWLKAGIIFKGEYSDTEAGTPQGGIISPCLANDNTPYQDTAGGKSL